MAALKMTAEREEVIDFIAPYFEQTGILIAIRNPVRQTSLFKFMTVLRLEVWLSIVAALIATAIMIWLLDKYSPYSARNNKDAYPYPCRLVSKIFNFLLQHFRLYTNVMSLEGDFRVFNYNAILCKPLLLIDHHQILMNTISQTIKHYSKLISSIFIFIV